jgi:hypothetical protein
MNSNQEFREYHDGTLNERDTDRIEECVAKQGHVFVAYRRAADDHDRDPEPTPHVDEEHEEMAGRCRIAAGLMHSVGALISFWWSYVGSDHSLLVSLGAVLVYAALALAFDLSCSALAGRGSFCRNFWKWFLPMTPVCFSATSILLTERFASPAVATTGRQHSTRSPALPFRPQPRCTQGEYPMIIAKTLAILLTAAAAASLLAQRPSTAQAPKKVIANGCISAIVLPVPVEVESDFIASGWLGDGEKGKQYLQLTYVTGENQRPNDDNNVVAKIHYQGGSIGWAGIFWQWPANNWGEKPVKSIQGATKISFWAAGQKGGEIVEFKAGGVSGKACQDSFEASLGRVALTTKWQRYEIPLRRSAASILPIVGVFAFVVDATPGGLSFYLDKIRYE